MPSKGLLRHGEVVEAARRAPGAAAAVGGDIDVGAALECRDALAANWDDAGRVKWLEGTGSYPIRGHARLEGERLVKVEEADGARRRYSAAKAVVVAPGHRAAFPPLTRPQRAVSSALARATSCWEC